MSDFLQFEDEVINGTPKYNITPNGDGTSNIELANEVIQQGTPLNKANLQSINNIVGYNKLDYTSTPLPGNLHLIDGNYNFSTNQSIYKDIPNTENKLIRIRCISSGSGYNVTCSVSNNVIHLSSNATLEVDSSIPEFTINCENGFDGSNSPYSGWVNITNTTNTDVVISNNYTYYHGKAPMVGSSTTLLKNFKVSGLNLNYVYDIPLTKNREIVKVYVEFVGLPTNNTLNGKPIDTILQSGKYYELMFDEPNDRFIAHEERV